MSPLLLLCALLIPSTCYARPNWHKGLSKNDNPLETEVEAAYQKNLDSLENSNSNEQDKRQRYVRQIHPFHFGDPHYPQVPFGRPNYGPPLDPQFQQQGLHPIGQLAGTLQSIIGSHLDATVQHNKKVHFGSLNGFHQPPGFRPLFPPRFCPYPPCSTHTHFHQTSHTIDIGRPQIIPMGTHTHQYECSNGGTNCREEPIENNPVPENPRPMPFPGLSQEGFSEEPLPDPSTPKTTTEIIFTNGNSDVVIEFEDKEPKNNDDNLGIDIRLGNGDNSEDVLPSKN